MDVLKEVMLSEGFSQVCEFVKIWWGKFVILDLIKFLRTRLLAGCLW